jgi:hypothetical protein
MTAGYTRRNSSCSVSGEFREREQKMKPFVLATSILMLTVAGWADTPGTFVRGPKNLMSPTYRPAVTAAAASQDLTAREARRLAATAEKASDHKKLASFYQGEADKQEASAGAYEKAAVDLRQKPAAKNFAAPGTAARWEFAARNFRKDAAANRNTASAHERMAIAAGL